MKDKELDVFGKRLDFFGRLLKEKIIRPSMHKLIDNDTISLIKSMVKERAREIVKSRYKSKKQFMLEAANWICSIMVGKKFRNRTSFGGV